MTPEIDAKLKKVVVEYVHLSFFTLQRRETNLVFFP